MLDVDGKAWARSLRNCFLVVSVFQSFLVIFRYSNGDAEGGFIQLVFVFIDLVIASAANQYLRSSKNDYAVVVDCLGKVLCCCVAGTDRLILEVCRFCMLVVRALAKPIAAKT